MKKLVHEFTDKSVKELQKEALNLEQSIAKSRLEAKVNQQKDTNTISKMKRRLAVLRTIMNEKIMLESIKTK